MGGYYTEKNSSTNSYDIFVSAEPADIADFTDKVIEAKVAKLDDGNPFNSTIFEQNSNYYFTYEDWKTKDLKVGDKVKITGKIRSFNTAQVIELKPYIDQDNPGIFESTSAGIFQISDIKKI